MIFTKFIWPPLGEYKREMNKQFATYEQFLQFQERAWIHGGKCVEFLGPHDKQTRFYKWEGAKAIRIK